MIPLTKRLAVIAIAAAAAFLTAAPAQASCVYFGTFPLVCLEND